MRVSSKGLGRGLDALFGEAASDEKIKGIRIADIEPNKDQPRRDFDPEALESLTQSIRQNGVITPITVRKTGDTYRIIAGERRWRAARSAGLTEIPAYVLEADEERAFELALVENLQREDLNPIEEAEGYKTLIERLGITQEEASERTGVSRPAIANSMRLLQLPAEVLKKVESRELSAGHGRALLGLTDKKTLLSACRTVLERGLSVRETEALVKRLQKAPKKPKKDPNAIYIESLQKELSELTGHKVSIVHGKRKGKLTIEYYGNDDLEAVCEVLKKL
ncbi:MAG: ParB/RepB/Spo0J family partition protein [Clostridia bacterium]|nr:ParB/RepB/Spo0J family partition protein [Clostridia bacterium]